MTGINFKRELDDTLDNAIARVTTALGAEGFGIMTRIDMHSKLKEKIGKDIVPTVILGACSPSLAYEAYILNSDVAGVVPCNAALRILVPPDSQPERPALTPRELECLRWTMEGKTAWETGELLGIAERTVKAQRAQVMAKLGATTAAELGRIAAQLPLHGR